jgi:hypothetical protein
LRFDLDCTANRVDRAAEFNNRACALDDPAIVDNDCRINQSLRRARIRASVPG